MLIVIGILLFIYILIQSTSAKHKREIQKEKTAFWNREHQANNTRKADISGLDYIKIPVDSLPFADTEDRELVTIQEIIKNLAENPVLNLTGISNTDLKLTYGVANIPFLTQCDNNFTLLSQNLYKWGAYLYDHNKREEAAQVLEFGIQVKSDISKNYILLAEIYKSGNHMEKINNLIKTAQTLNSLTKDTILSALKEIRMSCYLA